MAVCGNVRPQDLHRFARETRPRRGLRRIRAYVVDDALCRPRPFDREIFFADRRRDAGDAALRTMRKGTLRRHIERPSEHFGAQRGEAVVQFAVGFVGQDRNALLKDDLAGVHARVHQHEADAGFAFALAQRRLNRRRTSILRQQRWVDVERTETRNRKQRRRQNASVRREREEIDLTRNLVGQLLQTQRLVDAQPEVERRFFDRRRRPLVTASARAIGLRDDPGNVRSFRGDAQTRYRKSARSEEDRAQTIGDCYASAPTASPDSGKPPSAASSSSSVTAGRTSRARSM